MENATPDLIIAKRGDVLFQLSKDGKDVGTLLVCSQVLSLASPVFEAMFNGNFAEGHELSAASPKKIPLPDDDPAFMTLLCKLVHMQTADAPDQMTFDQLADFAVLCDKYACAESVRSWAKLWIGEKLSDPEAVGFGKLMFVTYVLDLAPEFEQVTLHLVRDRVTLLSVRSASHDLAIVPTELIDKIRNAYLVQQNDIRTKIYPKKFHDLITSDCASAPQTLKCYLECLAGAGVSVGSNNTLTGYVKCGSILKMVSMNAACHEHKSCAVRNAKYLKEETATALLHACDSIKGLCLDCTRKEIFHDPSIVCRLGHTSLPAQAANNATNFS